MHNYVRIYVRMCRYGVHLCRGGDVYMMHVGRTFKKGAEGFSSRYWIEGAGVVSSCAPNEEEGWGGPGPCALDWEGGCCCRGGGCDCGCCCGGGCGLGLDRHTLPSASAFVRQSSRARIDRRAAVWLLEDAASDDDADDDDNSSKWPLLCVLAVVAAFAWDLPAAEEELFTLFPAVATTAVAAAAAAASASFFFLAAWSAKPPTWSNRVRFG